MDRARRLNEPDCLKITYGFAELPEIVPKKPGFWYWANRSTDLHQCNSGGVVNVVNVPCAREKHTVQAMVTKAPWRASPFLRAKDAW